MSKRRRPQEKFLSRRQRYATVRLPERPSDDELARDWSLSGRELERLRGFRKEYRLANAVQLCTLRLFGRFTKDLTHAPPRIVGHLAAQLGQPSPLFVQAPTREATALDHQRVVLSLAGFRRFDDSARAELESWIADQARHGDLPSSLFERAEQRLLRLRTLLPGRTTLERLIVAACSNAHEELFEAIFAQLPSDLRSRIDTLLLAPEGEQRSFFYRLKEYPPSPTIRSMNRYLGRYRELDEVFQLGMLPPPVGSTFAEYLARLAQGYGARDLKRFRDSKRYALVACFLHESRKRLLDHLVEMHDKYVTDMLREAKSAHENQYRALRKRQKPALDAVLRTAHALLDWPAGEARRPDDFWPPNGEERLRASVQELRAFQALEERGLGERLVARYPSLRKYFAEFLRLPFAVQPGSEPLLQAIETVRRLDDGDLKSLPPNVPRAFVPGPLRPVLPGEGPGSIRRNAWETGLAQQRAYMGQLDPMGRGRLLSF